MLTPTLCLVICSRPKSENSDNKTEDKKSKITKKDSGEKKE